MFENASQGLFVTGATGYLMIVPVIRALAILFMCVSTYKLLKARQDQHKFIWLVAICVSPILARLAYEAYRRWIAKKENVQAKESTLFLMGSVIAFSLSVVLTGVSVISMSVGYIRSEIKGEPLGTFYDVHGNEYDDLYDVQLYDRKGNRYTHESAWFTAGAYIDQNGNRYDGDYCYLSEDGYFYFDEKEELVAFEDAYDYYTDGETVYYYLINRVYWEEDGTMYQKSGNLHLELFDFDE
jgi:hypothetical protein